ncbi:Tn7 transposase TnsA N-terminal domain-containing protein [Bacillus sp. AFS053548]|uniref:Tn7 transposase TnsA N-terminal domain-containing protein n=1 Tax=Bacillus sp. AFS053548 TaxID=2033505 RepID=UPI002570BE66|nr:Tn7 transposase TnsA N-terminal domain-containing protein [Bacillus sp. AFS053548]
MVDFCEQPLKLELEFEFEGIRRTSIFDMWIKYLDGREEFREIKYDDTLQKEHIKYNETMRQINIQKMWCEERGFEHRIITDTYFRSNQCLLDNYRLISAFARNFNLVEQEVTQYFIFPIDLEDLINQVFIDFSNLKNNQVTYISFNKRIQKPKLWCSKTKRYK